MVGRAGLAESGMVHTDKRQALRILPRQVELACLCKANALTGYAINIYSIDELAWATQTEPNTIPPHAETSVSFKEICYARR